MSPLEKWLVKSKNEMNKNGWTVVEKEAIKIIEAMKLALEIIDKNDTTSDPFNYVQQRMVVGAALNIDPEKL